MKRALKQPSIVATLVITVVSSMTWGFLDPTLEPHIRKVRFPSTLLRVVLWQVVFVPVQFNFHKYWVGFSVVVDHLWNFLSFVGVHKWQGWVLQVFNAFGFDSKWMQFVVHWTFSYFTIFKRVRIINSDNIFVTFNLKLNHFNVKVFNNAENLARCNTQL